MKEAVSNICEKIEAVLNVSPDQPRDKEQHFILDTDNLGISKDVLKVTDVVLNFICEAVHTTYSARNVDFTWTSVLLTGLSQYTVLVKDLFKRIWSLIFSQVNRGYCFINFYSFRYYNVHMIIVAQHHLSLNEIPASHH